MTNNSFNFLYPTRFIDNQVLYDWLLKMPDFDVVMYTDYLWEKHTKNNTKEKREIGEKSNGKKE